MALEDEGKDDQALDICRQMLSQKDLNHYRRALVGFQVARLISHEDKVEAETLIAEGLRLLRIWKGFYNIGYERWEQYAEGLLCQVRAGTDLRTENKSPMARMVNDIGKKVDDMAKIVDDMGRTEDRIGQTIANTAELVEDLAKSVGARWRPQRDSARP
jgi:hypothetical protein